jgi:hypothetical protein
VPDVRRAEAVRQQDFDRLADQLPPWIAKPALTLSVDEDDPAVAVHDHDGIGRRFQQAAEERIRRLRRGGQGRSVEGERGVVLVCRDL